MFIVSTTSSQAISGQKKERKNTQKEAESRLPIRGVDFSSISISSGKAAYCFIFIIRRITGGVLDNTMCLYAALVTEEEHVVHLLLMLTL